MKKIILFLLVLISQSLYAEELYQIRNNKNYTAKEVLKNDKVIYVLDEHDAKINWWTIIKEKYLFYLSKKDELCVTDLETSKTEILVTDAGEFAISDDLKYICVGRKDAKLNYDLYLTIPYLYSFEKREFVQTERIDFDFLMNDLGLDTDISYEKSTNSFRIKYHWETIEPTYLIILSLDDFKFKREL